MKAPQLKSRQAELKEEYRQDPGSAIQQLSASCRVDPANLAAEMIHPTFLSPAGLHPASGGDGTFACSVELMMSGLCSCAAVTLAAVANSMRIELKEAKVTAIATVDFRGTLAVDRDAPVGITQTQLVFNILSTAERAQIDKLVALTERYCVVLRTLENPSAISIDVQHES